VTRNHKYDVMSYRSTNASGRRMTVRTRRMVRAELLRPGDVLLLRSRGIFSALTSLATANDDSIRRYSHAALVLWGQSWFESNDPGVGFLYKRISKAERHGNQLWRLVDVSDFIHFDVYRHPLLDKGYDSSVEQLTEALNSVTAQWAGREYPPLRRLMGATPLLLHYPRVKRLIAEIMDKFDRVRFNLPGVVAPGPFCSELVVRVYDQLAGILGPQFALFTDSRGSRRTSPNDLADPRISKLRLCSGLVVYESLDIPDSRDEWVNSNAEDSNESRTREMQAALLSSVRSTAVVVRTARQIRNMVLHWSKRKPP
jgi:hypothetical protein